MRFGGPTTKRQVAGEKSPRHYLMQTWGLRHAGQAQDRHKTGFRWITPRKMTGKSTVRKETGRLSEGFAGARCVTIASGFPAQWRRAHQVGSTGKAKRNTNQHQPMKPKRIAIIATVATFTVSGVSLAESHENRARPEGSPDAVMEYASDRHPSSNLKKRIAPPGKGPVVGKVPFRHDATKTVVNHTMLKRTAPPGKGFVRSHVNNR